MKEIVKQLDFIFKPKSIAIIGAANSLWTDLGVKDNKWHIKLIEK